MNRPFNEILEAIPRRNLAEYPTPLVRARRLQNEIGGPDIWFKRDDLISFALGGNKVRALEVILQDALDNGADTLVTGAGVQSNHVRATAAVAAYSNMDCVAVYWGQEPPVVDGNYRVTRMLGAQIRFTGDPERSSVDGYIGRVAGELSALGKCPYPIPRGGACAMGALGHVIAVLELKLQCERYAIEPDAIVFPAGSGGTYAGWLLGTRLLGLGWEVECFTVSRAPDELSGQVAALATEAAGLVGADVSFTRDDAPVHGGFIGAGYGIPSPEGADAIRVTSRNAGLLLDPTYTGKAMAGYLNALATGKFADYRTVIFIHTGGEPAFFAGNGEWL
ncbi:MAG: pyridoxal-phosphate dependent enzyme [Gammaproteobacteria bacterium]|nr:pyridoxal-phosphate dependent enzyme [Gammaproteobacteria bacterium]MDE0513706.1 pyridoxal-phosphate dependent enzyme [Gammaproteobacteria bacterium]